MSLYTKYIEMVSRDLHGSNVYHSRLGTGKNSLPLLAADLNRLPLACLLGIERRVLMKLSARNILKGTITEV